MGDHARNHQQGTKDDKKQGGALDINACKEELPKKSALGTGPSST